MINYLLCTDKSYPPSAIEILQFMLSKALKKVKKTINNLPQKVAAISGTLIKEIKRTAI